MKVIFIFSVVLLLYSCWRNPEAYNRSANKKVWGSKPLYASETVAKRITQNQGKRPIIQAGNIYARDNYIFQVDIGRGIHVIDNSIPSQADRIGFITLNGCSQISLKGIYLYTNSYSDLVTLDISDPLHVKEINRVPNAFPDFTYNYPLIQPEETGYFTCPRSDSMVIGWVKDSIYPQCYK